MCLEQKKICKKGVRFFLIEVCSANIDYVIYLIIY